MFTGYTTPLGLLELELDQREYEGHPVPDSIRERVSALDPDEDSMNIAVTDPIFDELEALPKTADFHYVQPNDLASIRRERPDGPRQLGAVDATELLDRLHGAWTGRACGCALGKPVEGVGMRGAKGMAGRQTIRTYLENRGQWAAGFFILAARTRAMTSSCRVNYPSVKTSPSWSRMMIFITR